MEISKAQVTEMKKFAKELKVKIDKDPKKLRLALLNHINKLDEGKCSKPVENWFNTQVDLEEKAEKAKIQQETVKKTKERVAKQKASGKDKTPKSPFNHSLLKQAGKIDDALKKGMALEDIAKEAGCTPARVRDHNKHLIKAHGCEIKEMQNGKLKLGACA